MLERSRGLPPARRRPPRALHLPEGLSSFPKTDPREPPPTTRMVRRRGATGCASCARTRRRRSGRFTTTTYTRGTAIPPPSAAPYARYVPLVLYTYHHARAHRRPAPAPVFSSLAKRKKKKPRGLFDLSKRQKKKICTRRAFAFASLFSRGSHSHHPTTPTTLVLRAPSSSPTHTPHTKQQHAPKLTFVLPHSFPLPLPRRDAPDPQPRHAT